MVLSSLPYSYYSLIKGLENRLEKNVMLSLIKKKLIETENVHV